MCVGGQRQVSYSVPHLRPFRETVECWLLFLSFPHGSPYLSFFQIIRLIIKVWSQSPALPFSAHPCGLFLCLTIPSVSSYHVKFAGGFGTGGRGQAAPRPQIAPRSLSLPMKASLVKTETLLLPQGTLECDCGAGCGPTQVWQVTGSPTQEDAGWGVGRSLSLCV